VPPLQLAGGLGFGQAPPLHFWPDAQVAPSATQVVRSPAGASQQPEAHTPPVQQGWPVPPQAAHTPSEQARPEALQAPPQQGSPAPPHCAHTMLAQEVPAAVQVRSAQQA
jgi:hypothetical protein